MEFTLADSWEEIVLMRYLARAALALCVVGAVAVFAMTFVLTEQTPEETMALSDGVEASIVSASGTGTSDGVLASSVRATGVSEALFSVANVRAWAHVPEFFLQGFFLFGAAALWPHAVGIGSEETSSKRRYGIALLTCITASFFDQVHKVFVPGREFDARDLLFDALGYLLALAVVHAISAAANAVGRFRSRAGGCD